MADTLSELAADTVLTGRVHSVRIAGAGFSVQAGREDVSGCGAISLPLHVHLHGQRIGVLTAYYDRGHPPDESTMDFLNRRAAEAAVAALRLEGALAERASMARELSETLVPQVFSLRRSAGNLRRRLHEPGPAEQASEELLTLSTATLTELRAFVARLHPTALDGAFTEAVRVHAASVEAATGLRVRVECTGEPPVELHEEALRVVRDALADVVRRASATNVTIRLHHNEIEVQDDGAGTCLGTRRTGFGHTPAAESPVF
ncbi:hypothetical protein FPZ12_042445 [Amycolatopsis acidicola]|uniref:Signal transduction histidine kinase subgroup 3 dimerisation and phosphoacceptor domain-containing protein n=1 Tax=Amycolatopsis acidicola TaxID=2596893 RepID=A0A5N0UNF4_9PSEU|nr:histidine kinase [Amycolatopsis acidicola]KAA9149829.1 hypothetical protein FPZ12_042445 [Amycolatopsis acidicola]